MKKTLEHPLSLTKIGNFILGVKGKMEKEPFWLKRVVPTEIGPR